MPRSQNREAGQLMFPAAQHWPSDPPPSGWPPRCLDCGRDVLNDDDDYYVENAIWAQIGLTTHGGYLCLNDLKRRLGRPLRAEDFTSLPVSWRTPQMGASP